MGAGLRADAHPARGGSRGERSLAGAGRPATSVSSHATRNDERDIKMNDFALNAMHINDWILHGDHYGRQPSRGIYHAGHPGWYETVQVTPGLRNPLGDIAGVSDRPLSGIPALLRTRNAVTVSPLTIIRNWEEFMYGRPNHPNPSGVGAWTLPTNLALGQWGRSFDPG